MNCFVFYVVVDGVLCGGQSLAWAPGLFAICTVRGQVGASGLGVGLGGRHRVSPMSARAASPPSPPCFAHTCGAELFHQPPTPAPSHGRPRV